MSRDPWAEELEQLTHNAYRRGWEGGRYRRNVVTALWAAAGFVAGIALGMAL